TCKKKKANNNGRSAMKRVPRLVPNIHDNDQMSRGSQALGGAPRMATTNPENPARVTAICAIARRNPSSCIWNFLGLTRFMRIFQPDLTIENKHEDCKRE